MKHDPMCPDNHQKNWSDCWTCRVINLARNDEREEAAKRVIKQGVSIVAGRPAAREAVDALTHDAPCDCGTCRAIAADRLTRGKEGNRG
jgi:hypothetical protein